MAGLDFGGFAGLGPCLHHPPHPASQLPVTARDGLRCAESCPKLLVAVRDQRAPQPASRPRAGGEPRVHPTRPGQKPKAKLGSRAREETVAAAAAGSETEHRRRHHYARTHTHTCTHRQTEGRTYVRTDGRTDRQTDTHARAHACIRTRARAHTHKHTHMLARHTHTHPPHTHAPPTRTPRAYMRGLTPISTRRHVERKMSRLPMWANVDTGC